MSENRLGDSLLYLLSKKIYLDYSRFKECAMSLGFREEGESNEKSNNLNTFIRNLNALSYLDIGEYEGKALKVQIYPSMLVRLPVLQPTFLLTGARTFCLIRKIKNEFKGQFRVFRDKLGVNLYPEKIIIKPDTDIRKNLERVQYNGGFLSDYVRLCDFYLGWDMLHSFQGIDDYREGLNFSYENDNSKIDLVFDNDSLMTKKASQNENLLNNQEFSLVKIYHYQGQYSYYIFSKDKKKYSQSVSFDWGRFLVSEKRDILSYDKKKFELASRIRLPRIFEKGLGLLSGYFPEWCNKNKVFIFKGICQDIAELITSKLWKREINFK